MANALRLSGDQVEALLEAARRSLLSSLAPKPTRTAADLAGCVAEDFI